MTDFALADLMTLCAARLREAADQTPELPHGFFTVYADTIEAWRDEIQRRMRALRTETPND